MKAYVKKDVCIGCGACTVIADHIFEIGEDGLAETKVEIRDRANNGSIPEEEIENTKDAAEGCPVSAIEIEE